jgi:hypothetical protein
MLNFLLLRSLFAVMFAAVRISELSTKARCGATVNTEPGAVATGCNYGSSRRPRYDSIQSDRLKRSMIALLPFNFFVTSMLLNRHGVTRDWLSLWVFLHSLSLARGVGLEQARIDQAQNSVTIFVKACGYSSCGR